MGDTINILATEVSAQKVTAFMPQAD
jgi:hypothetical protein